MELYGFDRQFAMADAHDDPVGRFRRYFEACGQASRDGVERMVAAYLEFGGQAFKYTQSAIDYRGGLAVHGIGQYAEFTAKCLHDSLKTQAHAEDRGSRPRGV